MSVVSRRERESTVTACVLECITIRGDVETRYCKITRMLNLGMKVTRRGPRRKGSARESVTRQAYTPSRESGAAALPGGSCTSSMSPAPVAEEAAAVVAAAGAEAAAAASAAVVVAVHGYGWTPVSNRLLRKDKVEQRRP